MELRKLSNIKPFPGVPRQNDAAVDAVASSITQFGFRQPIVVDAEGLIVCGHTRSDAFGPTRANMASRATPHRSWVLSRPIETNAVPGHRSLQTHNPSVLLPPATA